MLLLLNVLLAIQTLKCEIIISNLRENLFYHISNLYIRAKTKHLTEENSTHTVPFFISRPIFQLNPSGNEFREEITLEVTDSYCVCTMYNVHIINFNIIINY